MSLSFTYCITVEKYLVFAGATHFCLRATPTKGTTIKCRYQQHNDAVRAWIALVTAMLSFHLVESLLCYRLFCIRLWILSEVLLGILFVYFLQQLLVYTIFLSGV